MMQKNLSYLYRLAVMVIVVFTSACTTLPKNDSFEPTYRISPDKTSTLSSFYASLGKSTSSAGTKLGLLNNSEQAFLARLAAAELAEHSLDLQYYHWHSDESGRILMQYVLDAADRGVRVRLLIDDSNSWSGIKKQQALAAFNFHPNIQIKLYNPLGGSFSGSGMRTLALMGNFDRVNHRMHNKLFIADNQLSIFGGRNIGNIYFGLDEEKNFRDMDVMAMGPQVNEISLAFDSYWNSEWAYPIEMIETKKIHPEQYQLAREKLSEAIKQQVEIPYQLPDRDKLLNKLTEMGDKLVPGIIKVLADPPRKDLLEKSQHLSNQLRRADLKIEKNIIISSPYFIPTEDQVQTYKQLVDEGVDIKIITNSLASNDVTMAQYGYASRRRDVLKAGVNLYELRVDARDRLEYMAESYHESDLGLHAKVSVIDESKVLIGSYNLDPRSQNINTEVVVLIESSELAKQVRASLLQDILPVNSYQVIIEKEVDEDGSIEFGKLRWRGEEDGELVTHRNEPNSNFMKKFGEILFGILPIDDQL